MGVVAAALSVAWHCSQLYLASMAAADGHGGLDCYESGCCFFSSGSGGVHVDCDSVPHPGFQGHRVGPLPLPGYPHHRGQALQGHHGRLAAAAFGLPRASAKA